IAAVFEISRGIDAILDIDNAPIPFQPLAIRASISRTSAIIHIDDGKAAARPVLSRKPERGWRGARRAAMAYKHEARPRFHRRGVSRRRGEMFVLWRVEKGECCLTIRSWKLDRLRCRDVAIVNRQLETAFQYAKFIGPQVQCRHFCRFGGRRGRKE